MHKVGTCGLVLQREEEWPIGLTTHSVPGVPTDLYPPPCR